MRTAGPNGLSMAGSRSSGVNGHGQATSVHADQDVFGTPVAQLMDGRAPELFIHDSPDGYNHDAALLLVNFWIPLQQITQPLVLADGRSIDRRRHQLRYGLATDSFLERDDDLVINDIWSFLHDDDQRWYFRSEMDHRDAHVFNTLSTAHGAGTLPGEDVAERCYLALEVAESASPATPTPHDSPIGASSEPSRRRLTARSEIKPGCSWGSEEPGFRPGGAGQTPLLAIRAARGRGSLGGRRCRRATGPAPAW